MERWLLIMVCAALGAALGSFLNATAERVCSGHPWYGPERSRCAHCGHVLQWRDLVPLASWLVLRGRCRYCSSGIPLSCLLTEAVGAMVGGTLAWRWGAGMALLLAGTASAGLFFSALTDLYDRSVFDGAPLAAGVAALLLRLFGGIGAVTDGLAGALLGFAVVALLVFLSRGGMGWGDGTLMAGAGAALGWKLTILALYLGFMIGGLFALVLLMARRIRRKDALPLAPFLGLGAIASFLAGPELLALIGTAAGWPW